MELNLFFCEDSPNVIGKTMTDKETIQIYLKRDVDIVNPVLILVGENFHSFNYAHIPDLYRYYFINDISNIGGNRWELNLQCDVLETYKEDILKSNARFWRGIQTGDYYNASLDGTVRATITKYESDKSMPEGESMILTTVGEGA